MPLITPMDELEAVNELLTSIGQSPVSTLASSAAIGDVGLALQFLGSVTRSVQLHGWDFNTDENYTLSPDLDGIIRVPQGVLKIKPSAANSGSFKKRRHPDGTWAIWNGADLSWTHNRALDFTIVWGFAFDDLPDCAKDYVTIAAGRKFQKKTIGSDSLDNFNAEDEARSWITLMREERAQRDTNVFRRNTAMAAATNRRQY